MTNISVEEFRQLSAKPKRSKYGNVKTVVDGETFDSKIEAEFFHHLRLRERIGEVYGIERQKHYKIYGPDGALLCIYIADFVFYDHTVKRIRVVDVKGAPPTRMFLLKKKLMSSMMAINVEIVR